MSSYLSWVKWLAGVTLHEEHVDELDEDAGSRLRVLDCENQPLIYDHEDEIPEETQQEEQLGQKHQIKIELPPEVPDK